MFIFNVVVLTMAVASHGSLSQEFKMCECSMCTCKPPCEAPWKENDGHCYMFINEEKSFHDASTYCKGVSAELVSIHSEEENDFVRNLVDDIKKSVQFWIGFHDMGTESNFEWEDGSDSDFTNWQTGEPNGAGSGEDCTEVYGTGKWNDRKCTQGWTFVCKK